MKNFSRLILFISLAMFASCSSDNNVVEIVSGNVIRLSSGDEVHLINVANSRNNYDALCASLLWQDVIVIEKSREVVSYVNVIHATVYTASSECINDMLEKELPVSSPPPDEPRGITPTDIVIPQPIPSDNSDIDWSKSNIKSTKDVSDIYTYVLNVFDRYGVDYMPHIPVIIISREQMYQESGDRRTVGLAYTQNFYDGEQAFEIHIISGLNRLDFAEVLAHEIMHTWVNQNGINISSKAELEGLCNYASYIVLTEVGNQYAQSLINSMMRNPDPIYGAGFRRVKQEIDEVGFHQYLLSLGYSPQSVEYEYPSSSTDSYGLEIPIIKGSIKSQVIHHLGYTVSYNCNTRIANWVAYELTKEEVQGRFPRSDAWAQDPEGKGPQGDSYDYKGSGWDRGHLAPAGDMKWSRTAMDESFYYTNITPQNAQLNSGQWRELEEKCRIIAEQYGSLYIICGGIVKENRYGTIGYNQVTVPDAFFKVLLAKEDGEYQGCGFYFENQPANRMFKEYSKTIDEIEGITGMDFFSLLPDNIENDIESKNLLKL